MTTSEKRLICECSDKGCPVHTNQPHCAYAYDLRALYRVDMEDRTGTLMCPLCADDAMESGLFTTEASQ